MNLSANWRIIGVIAIIASGLIASAVPFLYHAPLSANTTNNGNGSGNTSNSNVSPTPTAGSGSRTIGSTDNPSPGKGHSRGNGHDPSGDRGNTHNGSSHGKGHAYAYGHDKNGNQGKAGLHGKHLGLVKGPRHSSISLGSHGKLP